MNKKLKKKKGFTLIELIIVIAILGILALIAIPKFGSAQKDAKIKADIATAKTIANATAKVLAEGESKTIINGASDIDAENNEDLKKNISTGIKVQALDGGKFYVKVQDGNVSVIVKGTGKSAKEYTLYPKADPNYPDKK